MKKTPLLLALLLLALGTALFVGCTKEQPTLNTVTNEDLGAPYEETSFDYVTEGDLETYASDRTDQQPGQDRCCNITLTSFTDQGILTYSIKNPSVATPWARRRVTVLDADYGGIMYQYSWGVSYYSCSQWSAKFHLLQIVQQQLHDCLNRYQALMEIQTLQSNGAWVTCSSSLSPVFTLGTDPLCE